MTALIFDCDGVLADTERDGHLPAFNATFEHFGLPVRWSEGEYGEKLRIGGGKERMATLFADQDVVAAAGLPADEAAQRALLAEWHAYKSKIFVERIHEDLLPGRPGVVRLVDEARAAGWRLAVASTSAEASVRAVLGHVVGGDRAAAFFVAAGDVVAAKKPDPAIYAFTLEQLGIGADEAIVIEDSRNGLLAAVGAGLRCVVTVSSYTADESMEEAELVCSSLGDPGEPMRVLANRSPAHPAGEIVLDDLEACLAGVRR
ncbi:MAG TPA: HAD-IA family hydrolase [Solirubrobacterales bacterium]|nr:HAD-IA family hydrolase [Solirubrobacterales bacterium]